MAVGIQLSRVRVELLSAHRSANSSQQWRDSILIAVLDADGSVGHSECPTLSGGGYVTESSDAAWTALTGELAAACLADRMPAGYAAPAASAALADALLDLRLGREGISLVAHLAASAGTTPNALTDWTAVLAAPDESPGWLAEQAAAAVGAGASMVKLKVSGPDRIAASVQAVRSAVGVPVAIDANGSLDVAELGAVDSLELAYVEQPLAPGTPWGEMAVAAGSIGTPVALDESLVSLDAVADAIGAGAMRVASIKPARIGGVAAAGAAVSLCAARGVDCFVGGMFELGIGRAAALAVAALPGCTLPTDLGPSNRYVAAEVCEPLETSAAGRMIVPDGAGIGRTPDESFMSAHLVDRVTVGRATQ
ncbi:MAG: hypothetical protein GY812_15165 [Actinomycetia bacterium]|nr:hypothetical protein [Actinomycetes bacterium]